MLNLLQIEQEVDALNAELQSEHSWSNEARLLACVAWVLATTESINEAYADFQAESLRTWGMLLDGDRLWAVKRKLEALYASVEEYLQSDRTRARSLYARTRSLESPTGFGW